ncbi:MAG: transglutaminase domain-containing protein, partial [Candidatus Omnitrophica bacterium]|nr:transglutaminase domain-containing protein [Candidatus Omnitrophota bacterium]
MRTIILFLALLCLAGADYDRSPVRSPKELSDWLSKDFTYQWRMPMATQSAQETLETKHGSCLDFAILSQNILAGMGIHCDIAVVKFTDLNIMHAICIW